MKREDNILGYFVSNVDYRYCHMYIYIYIAFFRYDWRIKPIEHQLKHCTTKTKSGYVPLVWGNGQYADVSFNLSDHTRYLLGFNEPNHANQANMSPRTAASFWKSIESKAHGKVLVSPSAAPCGNCKYNTIQWLDEFFRHCNGCRVDHIATHAYWCNADQTMHFLKQIWDRYHKPIWLTEFACPKTHSVNTQMQYMKDLLPKLESASYIYRYAWFVSRTSGDSWITSSASLLHQHSTQLTTLGHYYNNFM